MRKNLLIFAIALVSTGAWASWYWPFGSEEETEEVKRLSELMEPASVAIDEAADLVADGKSDEAVEQYRKALELLDEIEAENPDRAATPEFASLRNKRAYVSAAIDSILLQQARANAKAVAITDTSELEKKFAERRGKRIEADGGDKPKLEEVHVDHWGKTKEGRRKQLEVAMEALHEKDWETAKGICGDLLEKDEKDLAALNIKAAAEKGEGKAKEAEKTLAAAIKAAPRDYNAYYNMAELIAGEGGNLASARRYYDMGRKLGGARDKTLEAKLGL
ncbi:MAG: hypothetical protein II909_04975 [Kiritimatiellae bacterium]|nr:hypothetical protein [Kiritimatiellia bacterium]